jgi:hypothetical protein
LKVACFEIPEITFEPPGVGCKETVLTPALSSSREGEVVAASIEMFAMGWSNAQR